ncbi:hypothetical protein D9619_012407 [Psilocybe cf. subviscida]|uniref:Uncharacterized protein n=1 Tax=Psilocybe cf. subviscida TaxID=2480587 RepID=A0A8H5AS18_9AGAR|nr:hypothetical protein D9619_012407 [Psilocybe cf. subviscida]
MQGVQVQGGSVANADLQPVPEPELGTMCLVMGHGNHLHKGQSWKAWNAEYFKTLICFFDQDIQHRGWVKKLVILVDSNIPGLEYRWWLHELFRFVQMTGESSGMGLLECVQVVVRSQYEHSTLQRWARRGASTSEKRFTVDINRTENGPPTGTFTTEYSWPVDCMIELKAVGTASTLDSLALHNPIYPVAFFDNYDNFAAHVINALEMNKNIRRLELTLDLARSFGAILHTCGTLNQLESLIIRAEHPMATQSADSLRIQYSDLPSQFAEYIPSLQRLLCLDIPGFLASQGLFAAAGRMTPLQTLIVDGRPVDFRTSLNLSTPGRSSCVMSSHTMRGML